MARIQVLSLPLQVAGPVSTEPFVLVIDQIGEGAEADFSWITEPLKAETGARAILVYRGTLDVA